MISVITPTYNRGYILDKAYESLLRQTNNNFEWLIVDDGSTDDTKTKVNEYINENKINISYYAKSNGGKHTALNLGIQKAKGELILILDSDDYLTNDAIEIALKYYKKYEDNRDIAGISFLRKIKNPVYTTISFNECIANPIDFKYNNNNLSDMCEVFKREVLLKYPFPVFENERFLSEAVVWNEIALKYNMVYVPIEIYCTEYLDDGLSKNWIKSVIKCPLGARANCITFMDIRFKLSIRFKNCIMYNIYSIIAKESAIKNNKMKLISIIFYIPCFIIACILKIKYRVKE